MNINICGQLFKKITELKYKTTIFESFHTAGKIYNWHLPSKEGIGISDEALEYFGKKGIVLDVYVKNLNIKLNIYDCKKWLNLCRENKFIDEKNNTKLCIIPVFMLEKNMNPEYFETVRNTENQKIQNTLKIWV